MSTFTISSTGTTAPGTRPTLALPWPDGPGRAAQASVEPAKAPRSVGGRLVPQRDTRDAAAAPLDQGLPRQRRSLPILPLPLDEPAPRFGASSRFMAQALAQAETEAGGLQPTHQDTPAHDMPAHGSEAYRRAGGQPPLYAEEPMFVRFDV